jgi:hypothetical protein
MSIGNARRIGLDLDNTIIDYAPAFPVVAEWLGLAPDLRDRASVRRALRISESDDLQWQQFQAVLYTRGLKHAAIAPGLVRFLQACGDRAVDVVVVSHKTELTPAQFGGENLRECAANWLRDHDLVPTLVAADDIHFCSTRAAKVRAIDKLNLDVFVDDLAEVLLDPDFPAPIERFLYQRDKPSSASHLLDSRLPSTDFIELTQMLESC